MSNEHLTPGPTAEKEVWTDEEVERECKASYTSGRKDGLRRASVIVAERATAAFMAKKDIADLLRDVSIELKTAAENER